MDHQDCRRLLLQRVAEAPPTRIQLLAGPRQVGKTTLLLELAGEAGTAGLYAAFTRRFPEYHPLVVCEPGEQGAAERLGVPAMSWRAFLWGGPVNKR